MAYPGGAGRAGGRLCGSGERCFRRHLPPGVQGRLHPRGQLGLQRRQSSRGGLFKPVRHPVDFPRHRRLPGHGPLVEAAPGGRKYRGALFDDHPLYALSLIHILEQFKNRNHVLIENDTLSMLKQQDEALLSKTAMEEYDHTFTENIIIVSENEENGLYQARPKTGYDLSLIHIYLVGKK